MTTVRETNLRLRGKTPLIAHIPRSYAMLARDGIRDRVMAMPWFATFSFSTNKAKPIQPESLPFCGIYLIEETMVADGNSNAGEPRFRTSVRIGFSVIVVNNDEDDSEYQLDTAMQALIRGLLSDPTLYNNDQFRIEGYTSAGRTHIFGNAGKDNQTPIAELRFELVLDLGVITYEPLVTDDLEIIHVRTAYPGKDTTEEQESRQQVETEYDLEQ